MGVLSDYAIKDGIDFGEIVVHPFDPANLVSASYDVRLGRYYYKAERPPGPSILGEELRPLYNIYSAESARRVWGKAREADSASWWMDRWNDADWSGISRDDEIIMLAPRANLLCHTVEFIGARGRSTTMMKARSSIGRSLVNVCQCAGMGDVGYFNRWTMEIHNRDDYYIPLVVGRRVAQIVFLETGPTRKRYVSKYQGTADVDALVASWSPEMMLPRLDLDRDVPLVA